MGAGTTTIRATQAATTNYTSATTSSVLTVGKGTPTLTNFNAITKTMGDPPFNLIDPSSNSAGAFTYDTSNTAVATISGNTVTILNDGETTITATQATTTNYTSATTSAILTVLVGSKPTTGIQLLNSLNNDKITDILIQGNIKLSNPILSTTTKKTLSNGSSELSVSISI